LTATFEVLRHSCGYGAAKALVLDEILRVQGPEHPDHPRQPRVVAGVGRLAGSGAREPLPGHHRYLTIGSDLQSSPADTLKQVRVPLEPVERT